MEEEGLAMYVAQAGLSSQSYLSLLSARITGISHCNFQYVLEPSRYHGCKSAGQCDGLGGQGTKPSDLSAIPGVHMVREN